MKQIETEIEIIASPSHIWGILMDFQKYPEWNPFVKSISGKAEAGETLETFIQPEGSSGMKIRPKILKAENNKEFRWRGKFFIKGIFDGEHYFLIEPLAERKSRFIHGEKFSGILAWITLYFIGKSTEKGFNAMNNALKQRAETDFAGEN